MQPERPLVVAVERVLPREARAAVHLDRPLARRDRGLGRERLRRCGRSGRLRVALGHAPGGPVGERAGELDVGVRVGERVRDGLVDADRLAELLACARVLDAELECALRHADRLAGDRRAGARQVACAGQRRAVAALQPAERARRVDRRQLLAACLVCRAVGVDDAIDRAEPGHEPAHLDRPALLAGCDPCPLLRAEPRQREPDRREIGAGVERVAELLEQDRLLDEAEAGAPVLLGDRDAEPAELRQLGPGVGGCLPVAVERVAVGEPAARLALQLLLLVREGEVHGQRLFGRPRTRSAMMLRSTSELPASIVLPRLRSCW